MNDRPTRYRLVLIGSDASQAMSPPLWNPVFEALDNGWTYDSWDVPRGGEMAEVRDRLLAAEMVAANVTMPHKHWAAETADSATDDVRRSGAANLLRSDGLRLTAHNTDISAMTEILSDRYHRHALLLGAGGAGRAALVALRGRVDLVSIADQDPRSAEALVTLASDLNMESTAISWSDVETRAPQASLIVNATPIGKSRDDGPAWGRATLAPGAFVYDFVYARHTAAGIVSATEQGLESADGWDHLRSQAAAMVPLLGLPPTTLGLLRQSLAGLRGAAWGLSTRPARRLLQPGRRDELDTSNLSVVS